MSDNDRKMQQQALSQTIEMMRRELDHMDSLRVKQVPFDDYRALVASFIDMSETLLAQFKSSDQDLARIQQLQEQLASLMPAPTNNPNLN